MPRKSNRKVTYQKLDITLDLIHTNEANAIDKLPTEILVMILAFVPYIPRGHRAPEHTSHRLLSQVSTRFREIVRSDAFRRETARCQFPEITYLNGTNTISASRLESYSKVHFDIERAVELVAGQRRDTARQAVSTGLHVLHYMFYVLRDRKRYSVNALLIAWARKGLFSAKWLMILRYTIRCVFEYFYPNNIDVVRLLDEEAEWKAAGCKDYVVILLLGGLSFETAVLMNNWRSPLHKSILETLPRDWKYVTIEHHRPLEAAIHHTAIDETQPISEDDEQSKANAIAYVKGKRWRMLSRHEPDTTYTNETVFDGVTVSALATEHADREHTNSIFNDVRSRTGTDLTCAELRLGGAILWNMRNTIVEQGVPASLENFVRRENLLDPAQLEAWTR